MKTAIAALLGLLSAAQAPPPSTFLSAADVVATLILIPAGAPHWYKALEGTLTYLEVRFEQVK